LTVHVRDSRQLRIALDGVFAEKVQGKVVEATKKIASEVLSRVVQKSPVDTGRFRGNWQVGIGDRPDGTLPIEDKAGAGTIARGSAVIGRLAQPMTVYVTNNLPYARRLEFGHSKQAPAGMVAITVAEIQTWMSKL
jgi:hypothetical protein